MKKFLFAILMVAFAIPAFASPGGTAFVLYSGASAGVKTSSAIDVRKYKTKTLTVSGATLVSNATTTVFKNMSGTSLVECSAASGGPWSTCVANDYAQTAVSRTTNGTFTWNDAAAYVRFKWTAGTVGTKLKAFLNYLE